MRMSKKKEHPLFWRIKLFLKRLSGRELWLHPDVRIDTCSSDGLQFCQSFLDQNSVVYSLGVGDSIAFDLQIIKNCGSTVHAFDPTPFSVEWIGRQALPRQFVFHKWAIAGSDGVIRMTRRVSRKGRKSKVMWTAILDNPGDSEIIEVPCFTLQTIMEKLNHERLDLVKMDVEGAEYEIIESLLNMPNRPSQLLVEFHHRFPGIGLAKTAKCIEDLRAAGYRLFAISSTGREVGFVHESRLLAA